MVCTTWSIVYGVCYSFGGAWTSKMANIMDPILPILSILGYSAITLGSFGGPGSNLLFWAASSEV